MIINTRNSSHNYQRLADVSGEIPVYQENIQDQTFETLGAAKDHILVVDMCNRLTYQVIMPWSILHYPYVKAAILSTYKDDPCGPCAEDDTTTTEQQPVKLTTEQLIEKNNQTMENLLRNSTESLGEFEEKQERTGKTPETNTINKTEIVQSVQESKLFDGNTDNKTQVTETVEISKSATNVTDEKNPSGGSQMENADMQGDEPRDFDEFAKQPTLVSLMRKPVKAKVYFPALEEITEIEEANGSRGRSQISKKKKFERQSKERKSSRNDEDREESSKNKPIPLRIILRHPHQHDSHEKLTWHDYVVLQTGNPNYHGHLDENVSKFDSEKETSDILISDDAQTVDNILNAKETPEEQIELPEEVQSSKATPEKSVKDNTIPRDDHDYLKTEEVATIPESKTETAEAEEVSENSQTSEAVEKLIAHYSNLLSYISYVL